MWNSHTSCTTDFESDSQASILVTGFDEDTKEEELIAYFYRLVYGGGTRNINDGKVRSCHILPIPKFSGADGNDLNQFQMYQSEIRVAIITFENRILADLALTNSLTSPFKGMPIFTEAPNEHS